MIDNIQIKRCQELLKDRSTQYTGLLPVIKSNRKTASENNATTNKLIHLDRFDAKTNRKYTDIIKRFVISENSINSLKM